MSLQNLFSIFQSSQKIGHVLSYISAILLALLTEMIMTEDRLEFIRNKKYWRFAISVVFFLVFFVVVLFILVTRFNFIPQEEGFLTLLKKTGTFSFYNFFVPFLAATYASKFLFKVKKWSERSSLFFAILLAAIAVFNGVQFSLISFPLTKRPYVPVPVEAISSLINYRMHSYPFALTSTDLNNIGDGSKLLSTENADLSGQMGGQKNEEVITEPTDFNGYISAVLSNSFAPGMGVKDYLLKAYKLFLAGQYTYYDLDYIACMWHFMDIYTVYLPDYSGPGYLFEALDYYRKAALRYGEDATRYCNMALVYSSLDDRPQARECLNKALRLDPAYSLNEYKEMVRRWADVESCDHLMEDALDILQRDPHDLSMIVLYSACALDQNVNVENAYQRLCEADEYFRGGSAMVKILRAISADLLAKDESFLLEETYKLEEKKTFHGPEETYLARYLFATNRSEELWGYIADVGKNEDKVLNAERALMKAEWLFKNTHTESFDIEAAKTLLAQVQERLTQLKDANEDEVEEQELLILARSLLQSRLGETETGIEPVSENDEYIPQGISYTEYAIAAITAFNARSYEEALSYCDSYFEIAKKQEEDTADGEAPRLNPQEDLNLYYYVQLISAYSSFEYAKESPKNSEQREIYMARAEQECAAFDRSSKSLFYIGELFQDLKNNIDIENGIMPDEDGARVEVPSDSDSIT